MSMSFADVSHILKANQQFHVLDFWTRLNGEEQKSLLAQIETLDFDSIDRMRKLIAGKRGRAVAVGAMEPADVIPASALDSPEARTRGEALLRAGKVGCILVAGGQGSRLGFEGPKGCYQIGPITGASLFQIHARKILGLSRKVGAPIPFYVMTSRTNDQATRDFFEMHEFFGLPRRDVMFFTQGMWPALTPGGRIILDAPGHIFMSPDGHGGVLSALKRAGILEDMRNRGLESLFYFQVDNPQVEIADPGFLGLHETARAEFSVKVCSKRDPEEGLGVVVTRSDARNAVVEYTELTREQKCEVLPNGFLKYRFGSVAIHIFSLDFLFRESVAALPLHVAHKKVPFCSERGETVKPDDPNAYKFEKFIFDALPDAERSLNVEFLRENEFSPVKNAEGADSPDTARRDIMHKAARWLESCGMNVPRNAQGDPVHKLEIDPAIASCAEDLRARVDAGLNLTEDLLID